LQRCARRSGPHRSLLTLLIQKGPLRPTTDEGLPSQAAALSLLFVLFTYFGPGMIKSVLTLRTGNAWVHALGYTPLRRTRLLMRRSW